MTASMEAVQKTLRSLGFRQAARGCGSGHDLWQDVSGRRCHPKLRKRDLSIGDLDPLGRQLETHGVISREEFLRLVRGRH